MALAMKVNGTVITSLSGPNARGEEGQVERRGARRGGDRVRDAHERGEPLLELANPRPLAPASRT